MPGLLRGDRHIGGQTGSPAVEDALVGDSHAKAPLTSKRLVYTSCLTLLSFAAVVSRRPDALFHPQFWAEDGAVWYQQAYNWGWFNALTLPHSGYYQTISRATAAFALLFPLRAAPAIFNLVAIAVQILPVWFLHTSRFDRLVPGVWMRLLLSFLYLALPNTCEINANLTNAQWHLGLVACMVILAEPGSLGRWKAFDLGVLALSGLSGPFCILLLPTAALAWYHTRQRWSLTLFGLDIITSAIQGYSLISTMISTRLATSLGASPVTFSRVVGGQVFLGALLGRANYEQFYREPWWNPGTVAPVLVTAVGGLVVMYVAWNSNLTLRLFMLFCTITLLAAMASPVVSTTEAQWPIMAIPGAGGRYYFLPMLAWVVSLVWLVWSKHRHRLLMVFGIAMLAVLGAIGIWDDWVYPRFVDYQFRTYARQFDRAAAGASVTIPINPQWTMELHKR
jgi:hypothetical protein